MALIDQMAGDGDAGCLATEIEFHATGATSKSVTVDGALAVLREASLSRGDIWEVIFEDGPTEVADFRIASGEIQGAIESVSGLTISGWATSYLDEMIVLDILVDGEPVGCEQIEPFWPHVRQSISTSFPATLADDKIHRLQFRERASGAIIAETVEVLLYVGSQEPATLSYRRNFPGILSSSGARRYESLAGQFATASQMLDNQIADGNALSLSDYLEQLDRAHRQVARGFENRAGNPPSLRFPRFENPDVSIVIPVHNKFWVTYNCLAALLLAPNVTTYEVIIVDDGSTDLTAQLSAHVSGIVVLKNEVSQGFVRSSNRGAKAAKARFVVMLNNDTVPCAKWLDELAYVFDNFDSVGLVGAKLLYPNGSLQEAGGIVFHDMNAWNYGRDQNPFEPKYNYTRQVDYVTGACIMLRKAIWDELGGFDELFVPAYYEDTDLAFRVRKRGLRTYYTPFSCVIHFEGLSNGTSLTSGVKHYQEVNEPKFRGRWAAALRRYPKTRDPDIAKDRGVSMKALVIDVRTPRADKDAGSYAAIQEMRLLQGLGFKVTFVPVNLAYLGNYTEDLQRIGSDCLYAPFQRSIDEVIERRASEFDIFYITRYYVAEQYIAKIRAAAPHAKIVFCNADLHFLREIRMGIVANDAEILRKARKTRDAELAVIRNVDVTLAYTELEAAVVLSHNLDSSRVALCPWVVPIEEAPKPFASRSGLAFIGNYEDPVNQEAVQFFISNVMPRLRRISPGVSLKVYGADMPPDFYKLASKDVEILGEVGDVAEVYQECRVFVAPLLSGAGIKGKVVGALAAGVPMVMTSIAAEGVDISRGGEAIVADTVEEWVDALPKLYYDEARWLDMSSRARAFARKHYSFEGGLAKMKTALAMAGVYAG